MKHWSSNPIPRHENVTQHINMMYIFQTESANYIAQEQQPWCFCCWHWKITTGNVNLIFGGYIYLSCLACFFSVECWDKKKDLKIPVRVIKILKILDPMRILNTDLPWRILTSYWPEMGLVLGLLLPSPNAMVGRCVCAVLLSYMENSY